MKHVHWIGTGLSSIPGIRRLAKNCIASLIIKFCSGEDLIKIEFPLEYKLDPVIFSSSLRFLLNSPTTPINKSLS